MKLLILQRCQTTSHSKGGFSLPALAGVASPYFFRNSDKLKAFAGRDINLNLKHMNVIAIISGIVFNSPPGMGVYAQFEDATGVVDGTNIPFSAVGLTTLSAIKAAAEVAVIAYATTQGMTITQKMWTTDDLISVAGLANAPQAAIANASGGAVTNLPTNYNLVSGLLGIANGLNDANTAQNALGVLFNAHVTKFNTLLSELRTLGLIS